MTNAVAPINVSFDISLDTVIGADYRQINEDGDYDTTPVTVLDAIVEHAMRKLLSDKEMKRLVAEGVRRVTTEMITERVRATVDAAIVEGYPVIGPYGDPTGKTTTLKAEIMTEVGKQLRINSVGQRDYDKSAATKALEATTAAVVAKELAAEVANVKAELRKRLQVSAAEVLSKAIVDGIKS